MSNKPTISTAKLADLFGVTRGTIQKWLDKGMPIAKAATQGAHGGHQFDLRACTEWYFAKNFERLELDRARTCLAYEQAEKIRMDNDERAKGLAEMSVIAAVVDDLVLNAKKHLLALPCKIAPQLDGLNVHQREATIDRLIRETLEDLAKYRAHGRA